jgi:type III secretion protein R
VGAPEGEAGRDGGGYGSSYGSAAGAGGSSTRGPGRFRGNVRAERRVNPSGWDWLGLALAALVPLIALALTSFVKISVVLSLLRNALGAPEAPSGLVVMALSLILTAFVMAPVGAQMIEAAKAPATAPAPAPAPAPGLAPAPAPAPPTYLPEPVRAQVPALERAMAPLAAFLGKHTGAADRATFTALAGELGRPATGDELWVLAPAFVTTELKEAFAIAVLLFIPFLVIDLVVGLSLAALGLSMTSPQAVALPLKLLLFVAVDGWRLVVEGLIRGYA